MRADNFSTVEQYFVFGENREQESEDWEPAQGIAAKLSYATKQYEPEIIKCSMRISKKATCPVHYVTWVIFLFVPVGL